jgi:hypothetical protein
MSFSKQTNDSYKDELREIIRFYELVKTATVNSLPDSGTA